jgi:hypothetical protein
MVKKKTGTKQSDSRKETRLWGAPSPEKFKDTPTGKALTKAARIRFTKAQDQNRVLALEKLALDIFNSPLAARAFAVNPEEYIRQAGLLNVKLDLNSQEVRAAMALGDPLVKETADRGDVIGFIDAVMAQGIKPSLGISGFVAVELAAVSSVAVISTAVVLINTKVIVNISGPVPVVVFGPASVPVVHPLTTQFHKDALAQIAKHIGDAKFAKEVHSKNMERLVQEYTDLLTEYMNQ